MHPCPSCFGHGRHLHVTGHQHTCIAVVSVGVCWMGCLCDVSARLPCCCRLTVAQGVACREQRGGVQGATLPAAMALYYVLLSVCCWCWLLVCRVARDALLWPTRVFVHSLLPGAAAAAGCAAVHGSMARAASCCRNRFCLSGFVFVLACAVLFTFRVSRV
jgi:hypothetical protein